jgi:glycosyltransferase involved in cell wall biosynthesis
VKVLIVSFVYPPYNSITGLGVSKVSRYLLETGWDVRVLCSRHDDVPDELPVEIPTGRITRTNFFDVNAIPKVLLGRSHVVRRGFEFNERGGLVTGLGRAYRNVVNFPDGQIGWYRRAVAKGSEMVRADRPDVILGVASPWTSVLVAHTLSQRFGIPWVGRYHDLWTDSRARGRVFPLGLVERRLEDRVTRSAARVITVSSVWRDELAARFPSVPIAVAPFGFEPSDYPPMPAPTGLPLSLAYTGRLYARQDPSKLFAAIRELITTGRVARDEIRLRFVGRYLDIARRGLVEADLPADVVRIDDPLPHAQAMALQQRASALVLFLGEDDDVGLLPAKMYEYLGARRPVLIIGGTRGHEAVGILERAGIGTWASSSSEIADVLERWTRTLRSGPLVVEPDEDVMRRYEWRNTVVTLGQLLAESAQPGPAAKSSAATSP